MADICTWTTEALDRYDVVLDSFCLQSIVLDTDRATVLNGVRHRLKPDGRYVLSTAVFEVARDYGDDQYDPSTGIVWERRAGPEDEARRIGNSWYLPRRRHLTAAALRAELECHGYRVLEQSSTGGDLVARLQ